MGFAAPIWLLGLLPWAAVALYLIWGRRRRRDVPFLDLWRAPAENRPIRRRAAPPPVALALALLAMLLAVLGAAGPRLHVLEWGAGASVPLVVDRGFTMSALGGDAAVPRFGEAWHALLSQSGGALNRSHPAQMTVVPEAGVGAGPRSLDVSDKSSFYVLDLPPTAADARAALRAVVRRRLAETDGPVIVLSDQALGSDDDRLIQVPPPGAVRTAGIVSLAAREWPAAQVMVRLRNHLLPPQNVTVRVTSAGRVVEQTVPLPSEGEADAFIDVPQLGETIEAELVGLNDDQPADDRAWLVREASWPRVEVRSAVPPAVQRVVETYAAARPPGPSARRVVIVGSVAEAPQGDPSVILARAGGAAIQPPQPQTRPAVQVQAHPVTRGVDWAKELADVPAAPPVLPPGEWTRLVTSGDQTWVAVRDGPVRRVWVGFPQDGPWARREAFVYFWANVLDWLGQGGEDFAAERVGPVEGKWEPVTTTPGAKAATPNRWPGLYRRGDGLLRAFNAPPVPLDPAPPTPWQDRLRRFEPTVRPGWDLSPLLLVAAVACLAGSAATWKRRRVGTSNPVGIGAAMPEPVGGAASRR